MVTLTELAKKNVLMAMEDEEREDLALRIAIVGRQGGSFQYKMDLVGQDEREEADTVVDVGEFDVYVDAQSAPHLQGVTVDFVQRLSEAGFRFDNPNSPWSDPKAAEVAEVIDRQINPAIASHGGFVTLIDVRGDTAYISMGGGCQGCGMADVTLKQGVEASIVGVVEGIARVVDRTDHNSGTNPYYQPSKK